MLSEKANELIKNLFGWAQSPDEGECEFERARKFIAEYHGTLGMELFGKTNR